MEIFMKKLMFGFRLFCRAGFLLFAAVFLAAAGCNVSEEEEEEERAPRSITLMTWNVHNLFDGKDNGFEYDEFLESAGWSTEKYHGRVNAVSAAIETIKPLPDVIIFQEIESLTILEDVALSMPAGYFWSHFANNHGAALGVGILSRLPLVEAKSHSITIGGDTTPRPVLEARIAAGEAAFVVFACHWKSKLGGDDVTEDVRKASARVILRRIRELWVDEPELGVIVAGDLNENHDEFYRQDTRVICALLPDDPYSAQLTGCLGVNGLENAGRQKDFIVISKNAPPVPVHFPKDSVVLFSPWLRDLENGSYFYKYNWETIDHFLISRQFFDNALWEYEGARIANDQPFTNASGVPVSYNARTGNGLSDHLPLLLTLKFLE
jgi:endonuclease/exonuclease/phosphatase family metal-dependent hydrolase